jgi:DNA polymerase-3 subunit gamma/tau
MSYLVLARRWRPQRFADLVGQPHVAKTLLNGLRLERVAHAYLFSGPRGVGKTTTARLVARALNCLKPIQGEPCGNCANCQSISEGRFIDVIEIDAASNTGVEDVRKIREGTRFTPIEGKYKVYIIDEVHMLSTGAFNALLKTLEEPPDHAFFCLATTESQKLPATIISRCQKFDFRRVSATEIKNHLIKICKGDKIDYDERGLDTIARRADGSVRDSLSLLDQVLAFSGGNSLRKEDVAEVIGEIRLDLFGRAVSLVTSQNHADAFKIDEDIARDGLDAQDFVNGLEEYLILLIQGKSLGPDKVDIPDEVRNDFSAILDNLSINDFVRLLNMATTAENDIRHNYNSRVRLQLLLHRYASFERSVVLSDLIDELKSNIPVGEKKKIVNSSPSSPEPVIEPAISRESLTKPAPILDDSKEEHEVQDQDIRLEPDPETADVDISDSNPLETAKSKWREVCDLISIDHNSKGRMIRLGGSPTAYSNETLTITFNSKVHLQLARSFRRDIQAGFRKFIGKVIVDLKLGEGTNAIGKPPANELEADPAVKMLMDRLKARPIN